METAGLASGWKCQARWFPVEAWPLNSSTEFQIYFYVMYFPVFFFFSSILDSLLEFSKRGHLLTVPVGIKFNRDAWGILLIHFQRMNVTEAPGSANQGSTGRWDQCQDMHWHRGENPQTHLWESVLPTATWGEGLSDFVCMPERNSQLSLPSQHWLRDWLSKFPVFSML